MRYLLAAMCLLAVCGCNSPGHPQVEVEVHPDEKSLYCVTVYPAYAPGSYADPYNFKCGLPLEDAVSLRNAVAVQLGAK